MKKFEIKNSDNKIIANVFYFLDYENKKYKNKKDFINSLAKNVPKISGIDYAGFANRIDLESHLMKSVFGREKFKLISKADFDELAVKNTVTDVLKKCSSSLKSGVVYVFIFPSFSKFKKEKMNGVGGFCSWKNTILIDINPTKGWQDALKRSVCHEFHHSVIAKKKNPQTWTLLESLVYEGMADNFAESIVGKTTPWVKVLSRKECVAISKEINGLLNKSDDKTYQEVFLGKNKKYPFWAGYSIGYQIVKAYLKINSNLSWDKISKIEPKEILDKSLFGEV